MSRSPSDPLSTTEIELLILYAQGHDAAEICRLKGWGHRSTPVSVLGRVKSKLEAQMCESAEQTLAKAYIRWLDRPLQLTIDEAIDATIRFFEPPRLSEIPADHD